MASCCCLWQQKLLFPKTTTFRLQTSRCKTVYSKLTFGCTRSITEATRGSCIRPCLQRNTTIYRNNRLPSIVPSQRRVLGYSTHPWPLIGANCVPRYLLSPLRDALVSSLHTGGTAPAEEKKDTRTKSKDGQVHGSVLMEMIKSQDQQPKQLTVGARGMHNMHTITTLYSVPDPSCMQEIKTLTPHPPTHHTWWWSQLFLLFLQLFKLEKISPMW